MLILAACGGESGVEDLVARAAVYAEQGNVGAAAIELKNALKIDPESAPARLALARVHLRQRDGAAGLKEVERALELGADPAEAGPVRIRALLMTGAVDQARARLDEGRAQRPEDPAIEILEGEVALAERDFDAAAAVFSAVRATDAGNVAALTGLARVAIVRLDPATATKYTAEALALDPDDSDANLLDGELALRAGDFDRAQAAFDRAFVAGAAGLVPMIGKIRAHLAADQTGEAAKLVDRLEARIGKHPTVPYFRGLVALADGDHESAILRFREVLSRAPAHGRSQFLLGYLSLRTGQIGQADELLSVYVNNNPTDTLAAELLATTRLLQNRPDDSLDILGTLDAEADREIRTAVLRGSALVRQGRHEEGIRVLDVALQGNPDTASLKKSLTAARLRAGQTGAIITGLERDIEAKPDDLGSRALLVTLYLGEQRFEDAARAAESALARAPNAAYFLNALGLAQRGLGENDAARTAFRKAIELAPEMAEARKNLTILEFEAGNFDEVRSLVEARLEQDADDAFALSMAGRLALKDGRTDDAERAFEAARAAESRSVEARVRLLSKHLANGDLAAAVEVGREAVAASPQNYTAILGLGRALLGTGELAEAAPLAERALSLYPEDAGARYFAGMVAYEQGAMAEARAHLSRSLDLAPENASATAALAAVALASKEHDLARQHVERLQELEGETARVAALKGDLAYAAGRIEDAARFYAAGVEGAVSTDVVLKLHDAQIRLGRADEAIALLEKVTQQYPRDFVLRVTLAETYAEVGRTEQAAGTYEALLEDTPNSVVALNNLALLRSAAGDPSAVELARRAYELAPDIPGVADTYGWIVAKQGSDPELALKVLRAATEAASTDGEIAYHYAVALARSGDRRQAVDMLDRALSLDTLTSRKEAKELRDTLGGR